MKLTEFSVKNRPFTLVATLGLLALGVFSFLTPLFGVALGAWLLDEPVGAGFLGGTLLVVSGVVLLSGHGWYRQWRDRQA